jgi:hypothetical protein
LDSRFALQAVRSVPPNMVETAAQLGDRRSVIVVIRLMTAAAVAGDTQWPRLKVSWDARVRRKPPALQYVFPQY